MILTEFDEKLYKKTLLEEGIERGTKQTSCISQLPFLSFTEPEEAMKKLPEA